MARGMFQLCLHFRYSCLACLIICPQPTGKFEKFLEADINPVFIHYQTKVCVNGPSENCFPEKCPDDARQLIDTEHMLSDFVQGGHMDESGQIIPNNIAKIVFDPLQDPDREKKQTWNQIIAKNFDYQKINKLPKKTQAQRQKNRANLVF